MTTDSQFYNRSRSQFYKNMANGKAKHTNESTGCKDMVKRDRFELLSAYLDGEVTAAERKQVEEWLENDSTVQRLYARLLKLRQGLRTLPVPEPEQPVEETVQQVLTRVHRRSKLAWMFGGTAIAAVFISAVSGLIPGTRLTAPQLAQQRIEPRQQNVVTISAAPLMLAINNPVLPIPKAAQQHTSPENPENQIDPQQWDSENNIH